MSNNSDHQPYNESYDPYATPPVAHAAAMNMPSTVMPPTSAQGVGMASMLRHSGTTLFGGPGPAGGLFGTPESNSMAAANMPPMLNSEVRTGQILDEADHKRCSEGNQRALLAEKLESLRRMTKDLEDDEWKYALNPAIGKGGRGASIGAAGRHAPGPF